MNDFSIIGIVGLQASGKTEVASNFVNWGASRVRMGDVVWDEVKKRGLDLNEQNVAEVAQELRKEEGMGAIAKRCVPLIREKGKESDIVIVDGIRGVAEVEEYKKEFGDNFFLLSVEASANVRYDRIKGREREDDIKSFEEFKEKDQRELEWGLKEAMDSADYRIVNEKPIEDLKKEVLEIFEEIKDKNED